MNSITDKISVKNFNDFLENEQTSRAFSRLAERKLKKTFLPTTTIVTQPQQQSMQPKIYRYNRDELIEISRNARSKMTKKELIARIKNPELKEELIRDDPTDSDACSRFHIKMSKNQTNQLENGQNRNEKVYHFSKFNDHDSDSWRLDRPSPSSRVSRSNRSRPNRQTGPNYRYENNGGGREYYEPEPEWFSDGPKSMTDFIDLKGFDDDCNNNDINNEETSSESFENQKKEEDAFCFSDISKDDFSFFLDSSEDFAQLMGFEKSRSEKWFKNKFSASNQDNQQTSNASCCNSLIDLFQKQNIDINRLSDHSPKIELSSAVNVSELEASFKVDNDSSKQKKKTEESSPNENEMAILSKLKFLADNRPQDNKLVDCSDAFAIQQQQQMPGEVLKNYLFKLNSSQPSPSSSMNAKFVNTLNSRPVLINNRVPLYFGPGDAINYQMVPPPMPYPLYMHRFPPTGMNSYNLLNQPTNLENPFINVNMMPQQQNYLIPSHLQPPIHFNEFSKPFSKQPMNEQLQQQQQQQDSVAHKLLKNSKFTPTSVFRKLKDHDQNKSAVGKQTIAKHDGNLSPPPAYNSFVPCNARMADNIVFNKGADGLKDFFQQLNLNQSNESNSKPSTLEPPKAASSNLTEYSKLVNANDIFNVFKNSNTNTVSGLEFPPLPLQNALTVEDIEKS